MALFKKTFEIEQVAAKCRGYKDVAQKAIDWVKVQWDNGPSTFSNDVILNVKVLRIPSFLYIHCGRYPYNVVVECGTKTRCGHIDNRFKYKIKVCRCAECEWVYHHSGSYW